MTSTYEVSFTAQSNYWIRVEAPDAETAEELVDGFSPDINWDGANLLEIIDPEVTETTEV